MKALTRESRGLSSNLGNKDAPSKFSSRGYTETSLKISSNSPKDAAPRTRSSERFDVAIDGVITAVEIVKGPATTLLWPLKGCFESLITVLEELRASRKNKETWVDLIEHLHQQINHVVQQVEILRRNDKLDESIRNFGRSLQQVIKGMESAAIHQKTPFRVIFLNRSIPDQIRAVTSKLDSAYNTLKIF
ncbi:hypothetical protein CPB86DRAFT_164583 [Serendipita vermifera]|nr:hypothetical protein CPB86DRAFT_164583 [Serendipita vermifera]